MTSLLCSQDRDELNPLQQGSHTETWVSLKLQGMHVWEYNIIHLEQVKVTPLGPPCQAPEARKPSNAEQPAFLSLDTYCMRS